MQCGEHRPRAASEPHHGLLPPRRELRACRRPRARCRRCASASGSSTRRPRRRRRAAHTHRDSYQDSFSGGAGGASMRLTAATQIAAIAVGAVQRDGLAILLLAVDADPARAARCAAARSPTSIARARPCGPARAARRRRAARPRHRRSSPRSRRDRRRACATGARPSHTASSQWWPNGSSTSRRSIGRAVDADRAARPARSERDVAARHRGDLRAGLAEPLHRARAELRRIQHARRMDAGGHDEVVPAARVVAAPGGRARGGETGRRAS